MRMLQGKGGIVYRHKLNPATIGTMKGLQSAIGTKLGIVPSQAVLIARAVELYKEHLDTQFIEENVSKMEVWELERVSGRG